MTEHRQINDWREDMNQFRASQYWAHLDVEAREFVESLESALAKQTGTRANIVAPFTHALQSTLIARGFDLDRSPAHIDVSDTLRRKADMSFWHDGFHWIVEIKTGLEFNSLGAAVLEALAFRACRKDVRFVLVCLYSKNRKGDLACVLDRCGLRDAFDQLHVLTSNALRGAAWHERLADRLTSMLRDLPRGDSGRDR